MQIISVAISNYRNLDGVKINFDPNINFLIGENELGKSNLLDVFEALFNRQKFLDEDFGNLSQAIRIDFSIQITNVEKGIFEDYFDPDKNNVANFYAIQEYSELDEELKFFWANEESNEVPSMFFRKINYIFYDSQKTPNDELTFYKGRGGGKFLAYLINKFADSEIPVDSDLSMESLIQAIQFFFDKIKPIKQQGIGLSTGKNDVLDFASRVLKLNGVDGLDITKSGYGTQFTALLMLSIFERLAHLKQSKRFRPFEEKREYFTKKEYEVFRQMYSSDEQKMLTLASVTQVKDEKYYVHVEKLSDEDKENLGDEILDHLKVRKSISMVLGLDEPEIHLHPYMQRSLMKYVYALLENNDPDFLFLLKQFFDIDILHGQILVVSHSPNILFGNYKHIIRFYRDISVKVVSGVNLNLHYEKHLLLNFPSIKEAFFSKCVILVEGATEAGATPLWANKIIGDDIDEYGITVMGVGGIENIPLVAKLLEHFKIPTVSIIDKDDNNDTKKDFTSINGLRTTTYRDFEEELFETIYSQDKKVTILFDFLKYYGTHGLHRYRNAQSLKDTAEHYSLPPLNTTKSQYTFEEIKGSSDITLIKAMFLSCLTGEPIGKTITLGRALGEFIDVKYIPATYQKLFIDAKNKIIS